jgi:uncharacterized LabA/DUF88 family protein
MKRIGVFVDVSNLYYCLSKKYNKRKLDYKKYYDFIADLGEVQQAIVYGCQMHGEANSFLHCVKKIGYTVKYKTTKTFHNGTLISHKADCDVVITIDIVNMINSMDMVILGSADSDLAPVVEWARSRGKDVVVIASGISRDLKDVATTCIEIPESLLEDTKVADYSPKEVLAT